jgi:beta-ureidopropionase
MSTRARIVTICQANRRFRTVEENRANVLGLLERAIRQRADLVCLPEGFPTAGVSTAVAEHAEPVPGPTTDAVAKLARQHRCHVICPLTTRRDGRHRNSAVVIDRSGQVAGIYDKLQPVTTSHDYTIMESGLTPGDDLPVFDLDFGRIGILICFDVGFPECWQKLADQGAKIVFWPSAYNGGTPVSTFAALHNYYVVTSVRTDRSRIVDPCGTLLAQTDSITNIIWRDINLDYAVAHYDFNYPIPDRIQSAYGGRVEIRPHSDDGLFLVEPVDPAVSIAQLQKEFGFETRAQYHQRHREAYAQLRRGQAPRPQEALHGRRAMYSKG